MGAHATPARAAAGVAFAAVTMAVVDAAVWNEGLTWFLFVYALIGGRSRSPDTPCGSTGATPSSCTR